MICSLPVTLELVCAPAFLLVSGESSHACLPHLSSNGALVTLALYGGPVCSLTTCPLPLEHSAVVRAQGREGFPHTVCHRTMSSGVRVHPGGSWELDQRRASASALFHRRPLQGYVLRFSPHTRQQPGNIRFYRACNTPRKKMTLSTWRDWGCAFVCGEAFPTLLLLGT